MEEVQCVCVYIGWEQSVRSDPAQYVLKDELEQHEQNSVSLDPVGCVEELRGQ